MSGFVSFVSRCLDIGVVPNSLFQIGTKVSEFKVAGAYERDFTF